MVINYFSSEYYSFILGFINYHKVALDASGVKVTNHDITPGANPKNGVKVEYRSSIFTKKDPFKAIF